MGIYAMKAVGVAVEHCLNGYKARSEYFSKPLLADTESRMEKMNLTEEEKEEEQQKLLLKFMIMESNYNSSKLT